MEGATSDEYGGDGGDVGSNDEGEADPDANAIRSTKSVLYIQGLVSNEVRLSCNSNKHSKDMGRYDNGPPYR